MKATISALVLAVAATVATANTRTAEQNAYEWMSQSDRYSTFAGLVEMAGLSDRWKNEDMPFTIFAPTNDAFNRMPSGQLESIKSDPDKLKTFVKYHMAGAKYGLRDLRSRHTVSMSRRSDGRAAMLYISEDGAFVMVNDARIIDPEHWTNGGVVHGIDRVLMPMRW